MFRKKIKRAKKKVEEEKKEGDDDEEDESEEESDSDYIRYSTSPIMFPYLAILIGLDKC